MDRLKEYSNVVIRSLIGGLITMVGASGVWLFNSMTEISDLSNGGTPVIDSRVEQNKYELMAFETLSEIIQKSRERTSGIPVKAIAMSDGKHVKINRDAINIMVVAYKLAISDDFGEIARLDKNKFRINNAMNDAVVKLLAQETKVIDSVLMYVRHQNNNNYDDYIDELTNMHRSISEVRGAIARTKSLLNDIKKADGNLVSEKLNKVRKAMDNLVVSGIAFLISSVMAIYLIWYSIIAHMHDKNTAKQSKFKRTPKKIA
jgi:hypothetical protein